MNERKLKKLFESARSETPPPPPEGFGARALREVRREERAAPVTLWEQLEQLFPRLAVATLLLMGVCLAADFGYSLMHPASFSDEVNELSAQWLFDGNGGEL